MSSTSKSVSTINETIITENYRTGYSYSVQGHNIKVTEDSVISPDATYTTSQSTGKVSFQWVTPDLPTKPQWEIVKAGDSFSLTENFLAPGLDAVSIITRNQTIETLQEQITLFQ
tara:strand:+ start:489 stop:833 length:345 start_codon:yes stop_codon:yes gene_type:complete